MIENVISCYPDDCRPTSVRPLGNAGGFSGAQFWKLTTPRGELCLRRWPSESPSPKRLSFIQLIVSRAHESGCKFVPRPILTKENRLWVAFKDTLFELTAWMPGEAALSPLATARISDQRASQRLVAAAARALAEFHLATAGHDVVDRGPSRGLQNRLELTERFLSGELRELESRLQCGVAGPFTQRLGTILQLARPRVEKLPQLLASANDTQFVLQPCIRDIWFDHVLFQEERVTGLVDFGALQANETVGCDIARLLTSVEGHIDDAWRFGVAAYQEVRPLSSQESDSLAWFRQSTIALSGLSWARWLLLEGRDFEDQERVGQRLDQIIGWLMLV